MSHSSTQKAHCFFGSLPDVGEGARGEIVIVAFARVGPGLGDCFFFGQSLATCPFCPQSIQRPLAIHLSCSFGKSLPLGPRYFLYRGSLEFAEFAEFEELEELELDLLEEDWELELEEDCCEPELFLHFFLD
jgi:hypothetical protein